MRAAATLLTFTAGIAGAVSAQAWPEGAATAPSGQPMELQELLFEAQPYSDEVHVIVRLLAPLIAQEGLEASELRQDMDWACRTWGHPAAQTLSPPPDRITVEFMEAPVARGQASPEIRQLFETYRLEGPLCIWEFF